MHCATAVCTQWGKLQPPPPLPFVIFAPARWDVLTPPLAIPQSLQIQDRFLSL